MRVELFVHLEGRVAPPGRVTVQVVAFSNTNSCHPAETLADLVHSPETQDRPSVATPTIPPRDANTEKKVVAPFAQRDVDSE